MKTFLLVLFLFNLLLLIGCERDENFPKASTFAGSTNSPSTNNAVVLTPADWLFSTGDVGDRRNPNNYHQTFVSTTTGTPSPIGGTGLGGVTSKSTSYTLGITSTAITDTASFCYWRYNLYPPTSLRPGKTMTLTAKLKLTDVRGPGISLVIRGDKGSKTSALFATTQGITPIQGTADFTQYSVSLPYNQAVDLCLLYVVLLPKTTGRVEATDLALTIH